MQSLIMTVSIYIHLTMVSIGRFEAMLGEFLLFFYIERIHFIEQNIKVSEKLNYREMFGISVVYYLKFYNTYRS